MTELTPRDVLSDLFGSADFPVEMHSMHLTLHHSFADTMTRYTVTRLRSRAEMGCFA